MTDLLDDDQPVYAMSVAAELSGLHPQTLRQYERIGWVSPDRSGGRNRRYSMRDILQLREVQRLAAEGLNLVGIQRVMELETENAQLRKRLAVIEDAKNSTALVVWQPRRRRR
jgi:MerR family transcriptional regulator/heat shock protein HspR